MGLGEIQLKINLIVPSHLLRHEDNWRILEYLSDKLYNHPEFFNEFSNGNVSIISTDIKVDEVVG